MKAPPSPATLFIAAALLAAMGAAFVYQGLSKASPPSLLGAVILWIGAVVVLRRARLKPDA